MPTHPRHMTHMPRNNTILSRLPRCNTSRRMSSSHSTLNNHRNTNIRLIQAQGSIRPRTLNSLTHINMFSNILLFRCRKPTRSLTTNPLPVVSQDKHHRRTWLHRALKEPLANSTNKPLTLSRVSIEHQVALLTFHLEVEDLNVSPQTLVPPDWEQVQTLKRNIELPGMRTMLNKQLSKLSAVARRMVSRSRRMVRRHIPLQSRAVRGHSSGATG